MNVKITPSLLNGTVNAVSSKSMAHRLLICGALADKPTTVIIKDKSKDIEATMNCISALGGEIKKDKRAYTVNPIQTRVKRSRIYDCVESGSTLRFMFPIICALGVGGTFIGEGRLPNRPMKDLTAVIRGCQFTADSLPITVSGQMQNGVYEIAGNVSSQYITGLLFALPLLQGDSEIRLTSPLESAPYVDMTIDALEKFGVKVQRTENGFFVKGGQKYISPQIIEVEGDWSNAAFFITATAIGHSVIVDGLNQDSKQGDKAIKDLLTLTGEKIEICVKEIPDLVPILAVWGAYRKGTTVITGGARLRLKESDRLKAMSECLSKVGVDISETADGLIINGNGKILGGEVDGFNDHRIVMSMAIAGTKSESPITITGAQAVNKSYPRFFDVFKRLGGKVDVL